MKRSILTVLLPTVVACSAVAALLGGCGSDSGEINPGAFAAAPAPVPSPAPSPTPAPVAFAGEWSGGLQLNTSQTGLTGITVAADGRVTGVVISTTPGDFQDEQGPVTGTIDADGDADLTLEYEGRTFRVTGTLRLDTGADATDPADDRLRGTLFRTLNGQNAGSVEVNLVRGQLRA